VRPKKGSRSANAISIATATAPSKRCNSAGCDDDVADKIVVQVCNVYVPVLDGNASRVIKCSLASNTVRSPYVYAAPAAPAGQCGDISCRKNNCADKAVVVVCDIDDACRVSGDASWSVKLRRASNAVGIARATTACKSSGGASRSVYKTDDVVVGICN